MKPLIRNVLVVVAAVSLVVPGVYIIAGLQNDNARLNTPENFIPYDSAFAAMVATGGSSFYIFVANGSLGFVVHASLSDIASGNSSVRLNVSSPEFSLESPYNGFSIFRISNVDLISLFSANTKPSLDPYLIYILGHLGLSSVANATVYATNPSSSITVIGELDALHSSLNAFSARNSIYPGMLATESEANLSLHYVMDSSGVRFINANLTQSNLSLNVGLYSSIAAEGIYFASQSISIEGVHINLIRENTIQILVTNQSAVWKQFSGDIFNILGSITL